MHCFLWCLLVAAVCLCGGTMYGRSIEAGIVAQAFKLYANVTQDGAAVVAKMKARMPAFRKYI